MCVFYLKNNNSKKCVYFLVYFFKNKIKFGLIDIVSIGVVVF